ncbi:MAG: ParB/RepB/Spo0J family partition protein [bacterium]|nr:ParB/RepB/Spo0J family partition protein [bacterium]
MKQEDQKTVLEIPLGEIIVDPENPRPHSDVETETKLRTASLKYGSDDKDPLSEMVDSIRSNGVLQAITVRPFTDPSSPIIKWMIVFGERRFTASGLAGLKTIPAVIASKKLCDDKTERQIAQLVENIHRKDLADSDVADTIQKLSDANVDRKEIAKLSGKSEATISKILMLSDPKNRAFLAACGNSPHVLSQFRSLSDAHKNILLDEFNLTGTRYTETDLKKIKLYVSYADDLSAQKILASRSMELGTLNKLKHDRDTSKSIADSPLSNSVTSRLIQAPSATTANSDIRHLTESIRDPNFDRGKAFESLSPFKNRVGKFVAPDPTEFLLSAKTNTIASAPVPLKPQIAIDDSVEIVVAGAKIRVSKGRIEEIIHALAPHTILSEHERKWSLNSVLANALLGHLK